jgi:UDP-glucose 4-epimerase
MKVLLTGISSFTGFWFARSLVQRGYDVIAPIRKSVDTYSGTRAVRVRQISGLATIVEGAPFGSDKFMSLIEEHSFDVLSHHAAEVANYRSLDFDMSAALNQNTYNIRRVLQAMRMRGVKAVVATGTVFEQDEGIGESPQRAFSPYGLSKGLTWQVIRYWCTVLGIPAGKFVVANPFGPFEEPRFCAYLIEKWRANEVAEVRTPLYLRDNIHVDLLALGYAKFVQEIAETGRSRKLGMSGYRETQGAFAQRVAAEIRSRVGLDCRLAIGEQSDFGEPMVRLNRDTLDPRELGWDETRAWDGFATYYFDGGRQHSDSSAEVEETRAK